MSCEEDRMSKEVTMCCPNCKAGIIVTFEGGPLGKGVIKECPECKSPILFCPDRYVSQAMAPFVCKSQSKYSA